MFIKNRRGRKWKQWKRKKKPLEWHRKWETEGRISWTIYFETNQLMPKCQQEQFKCCKFSKLISILSFFCVFRMAFIHVISYKWAGKWNNALNVIRHINIIFGPTANGLCYKNIKCIGLLLIQDDKHNPLSNRLTRLNFFFYFSPSVVPPLLLLKRWIFSIRHTKN